jgi:hypothetical protein
MFRFDLKLLRRLIPGAAGLSLMLSGCGDPDPSSPSSDQPEASVAQAVTPPCTNCLYYPDTLKTQSAVKLEPDSGYYDVTVSGTHKGWLVGPAGTDFALRLMKWNPATSSWVGVKTANVVNSSTETLTYSGSPGRYRWRIWSLKGSGAYEFWFQRPGQQPPGGYVFRSISAAGQNACAITTGNVAYCWGHGAFGQLGTGAGVDWANVPRTMGYARGIPLHHLRAQERQGVLLGQ